MRGHPRGPSLPGFALLCPAILYVLFSGAADLRSPSSLAPLLSSPEHAREMVHQELVNDGRAADFHPGGEMELQFSDEEVRRQHLVQRDQDAQAVQQNWRRHAPSAAPRAPDTTPFAAQTTWVSGHGFGVVPPGVGQVRPSPSPRSLPMHHRSLLCRRVVEHSDLPFAGCNVLGLRLALPACGLGRACSRRRGWR